MDYELTQRIRREVKETLSSNGKRFKHSEYVATTAMCLAARYGADLQKAYLAGILHDNAKCYSNEEQIRLCKNYGLYISPSEEESPYLLHAKLGAFFVKSKFGIDDKEISSAIEFHTTGRVNMTLLDKIIYISDYIEPNRHHAIDLDDIRKEAFDDIDKCLLRILDNTINHLKSRRMNIDPTTKKAYEYYKKIQG